MHSVIDKYYKDVENDIVSTTYLNVNDKSWGDNKTWIHIMSTSKAFVGLAYAILFNNNILRLDDSVSIFIPEWNIDRYNMITFDDLLTHRSGLKPGSDFNDMYNGDMYKHATELSLVRDGKFRYCNAGYFILSYCLSKIGLDVQLLIDKYTDFKFHWEILETSNKVAPGFAHLITTGSHLSDFVDKLRSDDTLYKLCEYCAKRKYGMEYSLMNSIKFIRFQDGYLSQVVLFNKKYKYIHLRRADYNFKTKKEYDEFNRTDKYRATETWIFKNLQTL